MKFGNFGTGKSTTYRTYVSKNASGASNKMVCLVFFGILSFGMFCALIYSEITTR